MLYKGSDMKPFKVLIVFVLFLTLIACAKWGKEDDDDNGPYKGMSAKQLYAASQQSLVKEQYANASKQLEAMETMYPFSNYAEKAQLNLIYAYYQNNEYASAAATAERFIHLYPRSRQVDYAYYMRGLANFQQTRGTFSTVLPLDEAWRDPGSQAQAYADFSTLVQKFPTSRYRANALQRMIFLRNMFAQRELHTANYYYDHKMYVAAAERASYLVKNYPQAPSVKSALGILYRSNLALGLTKAAQDTLAAYQLTYPNQPIDAAD